MMVLFNALAWFAQESSPGKAGAPKGGDLQSMIVMGAAVLFFMWLIVLRPQKRERDERQKRLDGVKKGDRIVTIGGIHGKVTDMDTTRGILTVEIAPKIAIQLNRSAVGTIDAKGGKSTDSVSDESAPADKKS